MTRKRTYIPSKPRNKNLTGTPVGGASRVGKSEFNQVVGSSHEHPNLTIIDRLTQLNLDILSMFSIVDGALQIDASVYATGGLSAFGLEEAEEGGGSGLEKLLTWEGYSPAMADFYVPASLLTPVKSTVDSHGTRLAALEAGSATGISVTGAGNAITEVTKAGTKITFTKGKTFSEATHGHSAATQSVDGFLSAVDKAKLDGIEVGANNYTHPNSHPISFITGLQSALDGKSATGHTHTKSQITDFPTSLPASDVYAWAKAASKPSYTYSEVGAAAASHTHKSLEILSNSTQTTATTYQDLPNGVSLVFVNSSSGYGSFGSVLNLKSYPGSGGGTLQLYVPYSDHYGGTGLKYRKFNYAGAWGELNTIWDSGNLSLLSQLTDNIGVASHIGNTSNPHGVTKAQVGLGSVDNTSDANKPVSTATQTALNLKANLANPTFTGTVTAPTFSGALSGNANTATTATYLTKAGGSITVAPSTGGVRFDSQIGSVTTGLFPASNNSNAVITLNRHSGAFDSQLGFSSNGSIYYRAFNGVAINTTQAWKTILDSDNYNTFAPTKTGTGASGTWGIGVTGNAATATKLQTARTIAGVSFDGTANIAIPFANLSSKPTTLGGYGITDALQINSSDWVNFRYSNFALADKDNLTDGQGLIKLDGWYNLNIGAGSAYGTRLTINGQSAHDKTQLYFNGGNGSIQYRKSWYSNSAWTALRTIVDSNNYTSYAPTKTGTGASGTWGIGITGNAATATKLQTARAIAGVSFDGTANIAIPFANLSSRPTTVSGYGITDAVTTNTAQTISGAKTFSNNITLNAGNYILGTDTYAGLWNVNNALWRLGSSKAGSVTNIRSEKVGLGTDFPAEKLHVVGNILATGEVCAYSTGGESATSFSRLDTWAAYDASKAGWLLSALLGKDLDTRISSLDSAMPKIQVVSTLPASPTAGVFYFIKE